jgi:hypothetical protein
VKVNELLSHAVSVSPSVRQFLQFATAFGWNDIATRESHPLTLECSFRRVCWSDRRQTRQQNVSEAFGVAHTIEGSDFDQFASEDGLQAFVAIKVDRKIVTFNR